MLYSRILKGLLELAVVALCITTAVVVYLLFAKSRPLLVKTVGILDNLDDLEIISPLQRLSSRLERRKVFLGRWHTFKKDRLANFLILKTTSTDNFLKLFPDLNRLKPEFFLEDKKIPYVEPEDFFVPGKFKVSWTYRLEKVETILYNDAQSMKTHNIRHRIKPEGLLLYANAALPFEFYLPEDSLVEIDIVASAKYSYPKKKGFDFRPQYSLAIDGAVKAIRKIDFPPLYQEDTFRFYLSAGNHTLKIRFINDYYDPQNRVDRNLLIRRVIINKLDNVFYVKSYDFPAKSRLEYYAVSSLPRENDLYFFFIDRFHRSRILKNIAPQEILSIVEIGGETHRALFSPPYTRIARKIALPPNEKTYITFRYAMLPESWDKPGDGITVKFTVYTDEDAKFELFSKYINPKQDISQRRWFYQTIDLSKFRGQNIKVFLEVFGSSPLSLSVGPPDESYDYAVISS